MINITDCCRICLKKEDSFIDIMKTQTKTDSLVNKLKLCVSEVEWSINNSILMCSTCVDKLNSAYEFKNQCLQSTKLFENYMLELKESQSKGIDEIVTGTSIHSNPKNISNNHDLKNDLTFVNITPNQQLHTPNILLTATNQCNSFQNIFLNLLPSTTIKLSQSNISLLSPNSSLPTKETNQNMFVNINNTLHKILPVVSTNNDNNLVKSTEDMNISKILNESNSEELSVEIDPTCFEEMPEEESQCEDSIIGKDWEDLISSNKITSDVISKPNNSIESCSSNEQGNDDFAVPNNKFVPIRPKSGNKKNNYLMPDEKMMEFFNIDHFMADKQQARTVVCEECGQMCDNIKSLHTHIRQVHSSNFPYRCKQCSSVYALQAQFEAHMRKHDVQKPDAFHKDMITLDDLSQQNESLLFPSMAPTDSSNTDSNIDDGEDEGVPDLSLEFKCEVCPRSFSYSQALARHKLKKHPQARKKYFVKGMKNAKCDICNREFSTQSYLQLHIKLHFRRVGYRFKVFDKNRYVTDKQEEEMETDSKESEKCDNPLENIETPEKLEPENDECTIDEEESNTQGLKIKINLRNLKNPEDILKRAQECEKNSETTPMDVDPPAEKTEVAETTTTDDISEEIVSSSQEVNSNENDDDEEEEEDGERRNKNEEEESAETAIHQDEGLLLIQTPPITTEVVNGKQQCSFCLKLYRRKHDLKRHLNNIHLKAIQYVCHLCNIPFYEAFQLTRHLRQHNGFVRCGLCLKEYSILRDLKLHISAAHDNSALCQCGTCGQSFPKVRYLREHMHDHDRSIIYKCHICTEEFKESRDLSRHLVEHSGMYACNICHTTFAAEQELNNHSKCHSDDPGNERKYKCEICPSKFKKKRYLMAHVKKTHANKNKDLVSSRIELDCKSA
ncbi:hypothetical protein FQR65_LT02437 [Abscondita terminalis]|nr:hypothetical protein FQR65_LT02437 [Abscondita terminalis]